MDPLISREQFKKANEDLWEELRDRIGMPCTAKVLIYAEILGRKLFGESTDAKPEG